MSHFFLKEYDEALASLNQLEKYATQNQSSLDEGNIRWVEDGIYYLPFIYYLKKFSFFFSFFSFFFFENEFNQISINFKGIKMVV